MAKKTPKKITAPPIPSEPKTGDDFAQRGWSHYSKKEFFRAESDFRKALEFTPDHPDYLYGLALTLQASGRSQEAVQVFEKLVELLENPTEENKVRYLMLTRLACGHVNRIKTGDWKMEVLS
jgi:tetratricopeptide (TPR) repeat protein